MPQKLFSLVGGLTFTLACSQTPTLEVTRAEFGENWPFTIDAGKLRCDMDGARRYVRLDAGNGIEYGLNGAAKSFGYPDSASIMRANATGADLQPFITRGMSLCYPR